jgi:AcrR family transcriptional regulator
MRETILETARHLVETEGVQSLSVRAIARAIGYSPAALYEYFPAKGDIYHALYLEGTGGLADRMRSALETLPAATPPEERMMALAHAYRTYALEQPELYRLAWCGDVSPQRTPDGELDTENEAFHLLIGAAREGVEKGVFTQAIPAEAIALACWSAVHGIVLLEIAGLLEHKPMIADHDTRQLVDPFESILMMLGLGFMRR